MARWVVAVGVSLVVEENGIRRKKEMAARGRKKEEGRLGFARGSFGI
jgi:hypothetical protein